MWKGRAKSHQLDILLVNTTSDYLSVPPAANHRSGGRGRPGSPRLMTSTAISGRSWALRVALVSKGTSSDDSHQGVVSLFLLFFCNMLKQLHRVVPNSDRAFFRGLTLKKSCSSSSSSVCTRGTGGLLQSCRGLRYRRWQRNGTVWQLLFKLGGPVRSRNVGFAGFKTIPVCGLCCVFFLKVKLLAFVLSSFITLINLSSHLARYS